MVSLSLLFLSTHSCGVRRRHRVCETTTHRYFYPRTPVECDEAKYVPYVGGKISIHALLWSATPSGIILESVLEDFYPRTPVECDRNGYERKGGYKDFYPRTPVECDDTVGVATSGYADFYPRTPVECD